MTVPLSNGGGQTGSGLSPDLMQGRPETGFGADVGLGKKDSQSPRQQDAGEMALSAAFAMTLANARAADALGKDDDSDMVVVASAPPPPVIFGLGAEVDPATRRGDIATLTQTVVQEIEALDRMRLGSSGPVTLTLPLNASSLGIAEARLTIVKGELTVILPTRPGVDPALVNAALGELAQALAQRYPNRTIRLQREEEGRDAVDPAEFNPLKEPVGRRK